MVGDYLCSMKLFELLRSVEFDALVDDLIYLDGEAKGSLMHFRMAFDILRGMKPEPDVDGSIHVEWVRNGGEEYIHAAHCEGDLWERNLGKEVVVDDDVDDSLTRLAARLLWHLTFYGFRPDEPSYRSEEPENAFSGRALALERRDIADYMRTSDPQDAYSREEWMLYDRRKARRNRAKRMRDARRERSIARLMRAARVESAIQYSLSVCPFLSYVDLEYLFETEVVYEDLFRSVPVSGVTMGDYMLELFRKYDRQDWRQYDRIFVCFTRETDRVDGRDREYHEVEVMFEKLAPSAQILIMPGKREGLGEDLELYVIASKAKNDNICENLKTQHHVRD